MSYEREQRTTATISLSMTMSTSKQGLVSAPQPFRQRSIVRRQLFPISLLVLPCPRRSFVCCVAFGKVGGACDSMASVLNPWKTGVPFRTQWVSIIRFFFDGGGHSSPAPTSIRGAVNRSKGLSRRQQKRPVPQSFRVHFSRCLSI